MIATVKSTKYKTNNIYEKTNSYYCHGSSNDSLHRSEANNRYSLE